MIIERRYAKAKEKMLRVRVAQEAMYAQLELFWAISSWSFYNWRFELFVASSLGYTLPCKSVLQTGLKIQDI